MAFCTRGIEPVFVTSSHLFTHVISYKPAIFRAVLRDERRTSPGPRPATGVEGRGFHDSLAVQPRAATCRVFDGPDVASCTGRRL